MGDDPSHNRGRVRARSQDRGALDHIATGAVRAGKARHQTPDGFFLHLTEPRRLCLKRLDLPHGPDVRSAKAVPRVSAVVAFSTLRVSQCTYPGGGNKMATGT